MQIIRRIAVRQFLRWSAGALVGLALSTAALAVGQPFDQARFEAAQKANKPILVVVHADWCNTCRTQEPILQSLLKQPKYAGVEVFRVDFDKQKNVLREFRVQWQSTLIVFKGKQEIERSTAVVDPAAIEAQLAMAL